ncbi:hypothetical protein ACOMHN_017909 [Nucella lapillus]
MYLMSWKWVGAMFVGGALLLVGGGVMIPVVDWFVRNKIEQTVVIANNSELWDVWSELPIPVYMQFYMFNLSNPNEVKEGHRPLVVQSGPYTYREKRLKYDIVFNDNGTVTYRQRRTFFFMRNMSVGDDSDVFIVPNPPVLAVVNSLQYSPKLLRVAINEALKLYKEDIFMARPLKEVLWGYTDPALKTLNKLFPGWFYTDFVGYFINKNDTDDGLYTVFTGDKNIKYLGVIDRYNGSRYLPYWTTPWANMVNGTDGTIAPPFMHAEHLPMFSSDICRAVFGAYQKDVKTRRDITLRRYVGPPEELGNVTGNPDNIGFCTPQTQCLPAGLLNISNCQIQDYFHIPVVVSFPHFYMADPSVVSSVGGMHPVPEEHETAVDVEPWTGLVLQAYKRLQINMYVTNVTDVSITGNVKSVFLPVFWLSESAVVDEKHADLLHNQLFVPMEITAVLEKVLMGVGAFLLLLACMATLSNCRKAKSLAHSSPSAHILRRSDKVKDRRPKGSMNGQPQPQSGATDGEREPLLPPDAALGIQEPSAPTANSSLSSYQAS